MPIELSREAEPVRDYIRKHVKRPAELPVLVDLGKVLRWVSERNHDRFECPLGLLPNQKYGAPASYQVVGHPYNELSHEALSEFIRFWDDQTDAKYAVNQVWGE